MRRATQTTTTEDKKREQGRATCQGKSVSKKKKDSGPRGNEQIQPKKPEEERGGQGNWKRLEIWGRETVVTIAEAAGTRKQVGGPPKKKTFVKGKGEPE